MIDEKILGKYFLLFGIIALGIGKITLKLVIKLNPYIETLMVIFIVDGLILILFGILALIGFENSPNTRYTNSEEKI